jgi:RNA polymerase sigma factor (sigma-70 family)
MGRQLDADPQSAPIREHDLRVAPSDPEQALVWAAEVLCEHRPRELELATSYRECAGLTKEQLEDLFQDTALALLDRRFENREHLLRAFRSGMKKRALRHHRDERSRRAILTRHATTLNPGPPIDTNDPEQRVLALEERCLIEEFIRELNPAEQGLLRLLAEGVSTRRLARRLGVPADQLYATKISYERKRENYTLLYSTGRLCGYRSHTIARLKERQQTSPELAQRAIAHLQGCPRCRAEHKITPRGLRLAFEQQAAALIPLPITLAHTSWLSRVLACSKALRHPHWKTPLRASEAHARLATMLANTGPGARTAAPLALAALLTTGAIGAEHAFTHTSTPHRHHAAASHAASAAAFTAPEPGLPTQLSATTHQQPARPKKALPPFGPGHAVPVTQPPAKKAATDQHAPGGFAYLGSPPPPARHPEIPARQTHIPGGGGEFSP